jgi:hypothetical protein
MILNRGQDWIVSRNGKALDNPVAGIEKIVKDTFFKKGLLFL